MLIQASQRIIKHKWFYIFKPVRLSHIKLCHFLRDLGVDLSRVTGNEKGKYVQKSCDQVGPWALVEMHQQPRNSECLSDSVEWGGWSVSLCMGFCRKVGSGWRRKLWVVLPACCQHPPRFVLDQGKALQFPLVWGPGSLTWLCTCRECSFIQSSIWATGVLCQTYAEPLTSHSLWQHSELSLQNQLGELFALKPLPKLKEYCCLYPDLWVLISNNSSIPFLPVFFWGKVLLYGSS